MEGQLIMSTFRELQDMQQAFRDSQGKPPVQVTLSSVSLNHRINYKGWNELKARQSGTLSGLGQHELYVRMHDLKVAFSFCLRNIRFFGETPLAKGRKHFRGV